MELNRSYEECNDSSQDPQPDGPLRSRSARRAGPELTRRHVAKGFIVTDAILIELGTAAKVIDRLDAAGIGYELFSDVAPNPPVENVQAVTEQGLDALADDAFADVCTPGNPREATRDEIRALYASLI